MGKPRNKESLDMHRLPLRTAHLFLSGKTEGASCQAGGGGYLRLAWLKSVGTLENPFPCAQGRRGELLRLRDDSKVRLGCLPAIRVLLFGFLVRNCRHD